MIYKGYRGKVEYDDEAEIYHGFVADIDDVITFQGSTILELFRAFADSIEDYIEFVAEVRID